VTLLLGLYRQGMRVFHGFAPGVLKKRVTRGREDAARWRERLGESGAQRPDGPLVWFHGVSVGESLSALPVLEAIRKARPDIRLLITSATTTAADILARRLPEGVIHQFAPIDTPQAVRAFLDRWRPDLAVFIESDIWPVLLGELGERHVPHVLLSARITEKTAKGWQRFRASMTKLLSGYSLISAQDSASEARLQAMGVTTSPRANLKTLGAALPVDAEKRHELKAMIGGRFVWLAASTHPGEDELVAAALKPGLMGGDLLVLAPRHPVRAGLLRAAIEAMGLRVAQRSRDEPVTESVQVYLADTLGELGTLFSLSGLVIMGGSFSEGIGGHNPLEAARSGRCVITGPDIANWQSIYHELAHEQAVFITTPETLPGRLRQLRHHPEQVHEADGRALAFSRREDGALDTVMAMLTPRLPETP